MKKIAIVEDDEYIGGMLSELLRGEGYETVRAFSGSEALLLFGQIKPDLVLHDLMLPGASGEEVLKEAKTLCPVIILSAKTDVGGKVKNLNAGASDYITKPFLPLELVARVKAQLRRYKKYNTGNEPEDHIMIHSGLVLNVRTHECLLNEQPLSLTPTEFSILQILCQRKGEVVSSEELFHQIWGDEYFSKSNNTITVHIRHLREKMGDSFEDPKYIKTVWGCGYKIET